MSQTLYYEFVKQFKLLAARAYQRSAGKGFWPDNPKDRDIPEALLLIHTEISEAAEGLRHNNPPDDKIPEFTVLEAELADAVIRILDLTGGLNLRVAEAIEAKMEYNKTRPHKHGKEF